MPSRWEPRGPGGVPVGFRLFYGIPQAFADVGEVVLLKRRWHRLAVLLGGVSVEMLVWSVLVAWSFSDPRGIPIFFIAAILFGGPLSVCVNLIPFFRTDGYWVLRELSGIDNLRLEAERAARIVFFQNQPLEADDPWWLPWYGMLAIHLLPALILIAGASVGQVTGLVPLLPGAAAGLGLLLGARKYRTLLTEPQAAEAGSVV